LADKSRTKHPRNTKIGRRLSTPRTIMRTSVKVTRPTNAETGSASCLPNGKAYELQNCYADGARYELPRPAIKAYKVGYCTRAGHTVSAEHDGHTTCLLCTPLLHAVIAVGLRVSRFRDKHSLPKQQMRRPYSQLSLYRRFRCHGCIVLTSVSCRLLATN